MGRAPFTCAMVSPPVPAHLRVWRRTCGGGANLSGAVKRRRMNSRSLNCHDEAKIRVPLRSSQPCSRLISSSSGVGDRSPAPVCSRIARALRWFSSIACPTRAYQGTGDPRRQRLGPFAESPANPLHRRQGLATFGQRRPRLGGSPHTRQFGLQRGRQISPRRRASGAGSSAWRRRSAPAGRASRRPSCSRRRPR